jgi:carbonyl reductase 1
MSVLSDLKILLTLCLLQLLLITRAGAMGSSQKVALITGGNKGIGFQIAKKLGASGMNIKTIIGCRSVDLGEAAAKELQSAGCDVVFKKLDICDPASIESVRASIEKDFGGLDILVNNAAIAFKGSDPTPFKEQARPTIMVNFFCTLDVTKAMLPLLRKSSSARIVNVASMAGHLRILPSEERKSKFTSPALQLGDLELMMHEFVSDVETGSHSKNGWPNTCYGMSKLGVIAMTNVIARDEPKIMVNSCCPGLCATDMSSMGGSRTAEHGARTPAMLALMPDSKAERAQPSGKFFSDEAEEAW